MDSAAAIDRRIPSTLRNPSSLSAESSTDRRSDSAIDHTKERLALERAEDTFQRVSTSSPVANLFANFRADTTSSSPVRAVAHTGTAARVAHPRAAQPEDL